MRILSPFITVFPCLLFRQHSYRKTQNGQMVHSLQSSQHGGRARPEDSIYPSNKVRARIWAEPNPWITLHGRFKTRQDPTRVCWCWKARGHLENILSFKILLKPSQNITFWFINTVNNMKPLYYNDAWHVLPVNNRLLNVITLSLICDLMRESRHVAANLIDSYTNPNSHQTRSQYQNQRAWSRALHGHNRWSENCQ